MNGTSISGSGVVFSRGLADTANFVPLTDYRIVAGIKKVRASIAMTAETGSIQIAPAYRTAETRLATPDGAVKLGALAYLGADGFQYATAFDDLVNAIGDKQLIQFGILAKQDADGGIQACQASVTVDFHSV